MDEGEEEKGGGDRMEVESGDPEEVELSSDDEIGGVGKGCERATPLL